MRVVTLASGKTSFDHGDETHVWISTSLDFPRCGYSMRLYCETAQRCQSPLGTGAFPVSIMITELMGLWKISAHGS